MTQKGQRIITLDGDFSVNCWAEKTRYGFRHLAVLLKGGLEVCRDKACYYNRTWERYEYQSVIHSVLRKYFGNRKADSDLTKKYIAVTDGLPDPGLKHLKAVGAIALLGNIFCDKKEEKNKWKERFLKLLPGIDIPEDFDSLSEEEKEKRLNGAIKAISE